MLTRRTALGGAASGLLATAGGWPAGAQAPAPPLLGPICGVTTTASALGPVEAAYTRYLGYRVVQRGVVSAATARAWGAPAVAGRRVLVMEPESGEQTLLRFVEQAQPPGFKPMTTYGWNATEIIVQDTDKVAARLAGAPPFRIVGPPRSLDSTAEIRAMQALGPANEMLYLTSSPPLPGRDMPEAKSLVGRCFITVLGTRDIEAAKAFYRDTFAAPSGNNFNSRILNLSAQNGLSPETRYDLTVAQLGSGTKIELDQFPSVATVRPRPRGGLPHGMAMVTFECAQFDRFRDRMIAPPTPARLGPHKGRRSGVVRGAVGELIELVEV